MKKTLSHLFALALSLAGASLAQENYVNWGYYRPITVTTTSGGANVSQTESNFPLLVRLTSSNFTFSHAKGNGADIRFTDAAGTTRYKHQIERWDSLGGTASVWVLVPSVAGNSTTSLRVYSGRDIAADSSNGSAVFSTANNFQGVFHLNEATGDTARDATTNRFKGVPRNRGGTNPTDTTGAIGNAKRFLGDTTNINGGSYQILTSTGANTLTNNPLNFQNDSSTAGGSGLPLYTISAWVKVRQFPYSTSKQKAIVSKGGGTLGNTQYALRLMDPSINQTTTPVGDTMRVQFTDWVPATYKSGLNNLTSATWYHVAAVRSGARGTLGNSRVWINGYAPPVTDPGVSTTSTTNTQEQISQGVYIGSFASDSAYFTGIIDEVEFSSTARDSGWFMLSYQTQKPGATATAVGAEVANPIPPGVFTYTTNPLSLVAGVAMVADSAHVTNTVSYAVSPALPGGLSLNTGNGAITGTPTAGTAVATATYTVTATGSGGATSSVGVVLTILAPPSITNQPIATSLRLNPNLAGGGGVARFGIKATGSATLLYRWVRTRGVVVDTPSNGGGTGSPATAIFSGVSTDTLTITNPPASDSGTTYKCVVVNSAGNAVSNAGILVVGSTVGLWRPQVIHVTGMNPFSFRVPVTGVSSVRMTVENMSGRVVWSHDIKASASGIVSWNGGGSDGRPVAAGMYIVKMKMLNADNNSLGEATQTGINAR